MQRHISREHAPSDSAPCSNGSRTPSSPTSPNAVTPSPSPSPPSSYSLSPEFPSLPTNAPSSCDPTSSPSPIACLMLAALQRDVHAQYSLLQTLSTPDIAGLVGSCRTWRDWVTHPTAHLVSAYGDRGELSLLQLQAHASSSWSHQYWKTIRVSIALAPMLVPLPRASWHHPDSAAYASESAVLGQERMIEQSHPRDSPMAQLHAQLCNQMWSTLVVFKQLSSLHLTIDSAFLDPTLLRLCIIAIGGRLAILRCTIVDLDPLASITAVLEALDPRPVRSTPPSPSLSSSGALAAIVEDETMEPLALLPPPTPCAVRKLEYLSFEMERVVESCTDQHRFASADFEPLAHCPKLNTFLLYYSKAPTDRVAPYRFTCTPKQAEALGRCHSLHTLSCGSWSDPPVLDSASAPAIPSSEPADSFDESDEQRFNNPSSVLGAFVHGRTTSTGHGAVDDQPCQAMAIDSCTTVIPIRHLHLNATEITPAVWHRLKGLRSLRELWANGWSAAIADENWRELAKFSHLRLLAIGPCESEYEQRKHVRSEQYVPYVLHCRYLRKLSLCYVELTADQLTHLIQALVRLERLDLAHAQLESLRPVGEASALTHLALSFITSLPAVGVGSVIAVRRSIPPMPSLRSITLGGPTAHDDLSSSEWERRWIRRHLPRLTERVDELITEAPPADLAQDEALAIALEAEAVADAADAAEQLEDDEAAPTGGTGGAFWGVVGRVASALFSSRS